MQARFLAVAPLLTALALPAAAQGGHRADRVRPQAPEQGPAENTRFTPVLQAGQRLDISNIDGRITVVQTSGPAEIIAHKIVRRGDGTRVKSVMEETERGVRICTVYLNRDRSNDGCETHGHHGGNNDVRDPLDVDVAYDVRLPAGVELAVHTVDGNVDARGIDTPATVNTVDGDIMFEGVAPLSLNTVDGKIIATITTRGWDHDVDVRTVDGSIELTLPVGVAVDVSGTTVDGEIKSDFPVTLAGSWGPRSFHGRIGEGGTRTLKLSTVDGSIHLRRGDHE